MLLVSIRLNKHFVECHTRRNDLEVAQINCFEQRVEGF